MTVRTRVAAVAAACITALGVTAGPSFAGTTTHVPAPMTGPFVLMPPPPGVVVPSSCLFGVSDPLSFVFTGGNAVFHDESHPYNGTDWGGETIEGPAVMLDGDTAIYQGHLTFWGGGGNNATGQAEGGETLNFTGTGVSDPSQSVTFHVNGHTTFPNNNDGTPTVSVFNAQISCS